MSSLLRSSKFIRYFATAARNIVGSSSRVQLDAAQSQNVQLLASCVRLLSTKTSGAPQFASNLEKSLYYLDQDVRKTGRISRKELEEVLSEIKQSKSATSSQSLMVIRCCGNLVPEELPKVRTKLVQEIWATLEKLKVPMDISHYNALLRVYLENEHDFSPAEFLQELEKKGVEPNRVTYQRLVTRYCQEGDIEGATRILEFMRDKSIPVNEHVFNALIMGHCQAEDIESATGILKVMQQAGLEPSSDTYTTLLVGHAKRGDMETIRNILAECDKKEINLLDKDHLDVVYALATSGHVDQVDELLSRVRKSSGFNQDAVSTILRLVNQGQESVAMKVLLLMARPQKENGEPSYTGTFFIKQLVKAERPLESVLSICESLEKEGVHARALCVAAESALMQGNSQLAFKLLQAFQEYGAPIRQHYFWPLFCSAKSDEEIASILKQIHEVFGLTASNETVRDYVLPNLRLKDPDEVIAFLMKAGISSGATASALIFDLLLSGEIAEASSIASKYRAYYNPLLYRRPLNSAYIKTKATKPYLNLLHQFYEGLGRISQGDDNEGHNGDRREIVGYYLLDLLYAARGQPINLEAILEGLLQRGLGLTNEAAEQIQGKLGELLTNEISDLLTKLTGSELQVTRAGRTRGPAFMPDVDVLRDRLKKSDSTDNSSRIKRALLIQLVKDRQMDEAEELLKDIGKDAGPGLYASFIDGLTVAGKLDQALECLQKFKENFPDASLDYLKRFRLAEALVKADRIEEAIRLLEESSDEKSGDVPFAVKSEAFRLLNTLAEKGDEASLERVFNILVSNHSIEVSNVLVGPLVKIYILKDDIPSALNKLDEMAEKYKMTPWKSEIAKRLIQKEDATALQRLTDISSKVHGEVNSLYDLVFSFVECGRIRQARKILETPGLHNRDQRLLQICERYKEEGNVAALEGLAEATRDVSNIDRSLIFNQLLAIYVKNGDPTKAIALWTQMQEEDLQPSDDFLVNLANFLEAQGVDVPFVKPDAVPPVQQSSPKTPQKKTNMKSQPSLSIALKNALRARDIDEAMKIKDDLDAQNVTIPSGDLSRLMEALCQNNRLNEAHNIALRLVSSGSEFSLRNFKFLVAKLSNAGEVEKLESIGKLISMDLKKLCSFDNKLAGAYLKSGQAEKLANNLLAEVESAKPEDLERLESKLPRAVLGSIIEISPELLPKVELIADKYAKLGSISAANSLWMSMFVTPGLEERAEKIWETYDFSNSNRIMLQRIFKKALIEQDHDLIERLINRLEGSKISEGGLGNTFSVSIRILVEQNRLEEAETKLKKYLEKVSLERISISSLKKLKQALETSGKSFPYTIPPKQIKSSTSSSSDDESEERGERK